MWGKFSTVYLLASRLPVGSEVATRDMAKAYRTIPLHSSQWPAAVVRISDLLGCIDTSLAFGAAPSAGVYGHLADAAAQIFRHRGLGPIDKWVDDHVFFHIRKEHLADYNLTRNAWKSDIASHAGFQHIKGRFWFAGRPLLNGASEEFNEDCSSPIADLSLASSHSLHNASFTYSLADIDTISNELGIPWEICKDQPFSHSTIYIGFVWNLCERTVSLSQSKADKYIAAIDTWLSRATHVLQDVSQLYGKLLHAASLIPQGRAYLIGFEHMLAVCNAKPFMPHRPDKAISSDLLWWRTAITSGLVSLPISPPQTIVDLNAFSDASSSVGIAVVIGEQWRAWRLLPGWQTLCGKRDITWAEAIGFEFLILILSKLIHRPSHLVVHGDNTSVVKSWWSGRHRNKEINRIFKRIHALVADSANRVSRVYTKYIPSLNNPTVPIPSHFGGLVVDYDAPITPDEVHALSSGTLHPPAAQRIERLKRKQEARERNELLCKQHTLRRLRSEKATPDSIPLQ